MKMRGRHSVRPLPTIQQGTFSAISTAQPCRGMSPARAPHSLASDRHILAGLSYGCNFFNEQAASCGRNSSERLGPRPHSTPQPSASVWRGEESDAEMSPRTWNDSWLSFKSVASQRHYIRKCIWGKLPGGWGICLAHPSAEDGGMIFAWKTLKGASVHFLTLNLRGGDF